MPTLIRPLRWSARECRDVCAAWPVVLAVRVALWLGPYHWLEQRVLQRPRGPYRADAPHRVGAAVRRASRAVPASTCLVDALAAAWMLRGAGHTPQLFLGVRGGAHDFAAHSWLDCDGQTVVGGETAADYLPFDRP